VIGVSKDTQDTNDRFATSLELPYPIVGDAGGTILEAYGVRWPIIGICRRVSYVIGKDRKIRHAFKSETNPDAHVAEACAFVRR
jgi:thioredoxin-dependent peroxiredoxin